MERWTMWAIIRKLYIKHLFIDKLNKYISKSYADVVNLAHLQDSEWRVIFLRLRRLHQLYHMEILYTMNICAAVFQQSHYLANLPNAKLGVEITCKID